ncbi:MAG TPA: hypothetical protein VEZ90_04040 [Blastocatellia bacterium]|nr:hypothetical protein [Blastocatellia bacterium]
MESTANPPVVVPLSTSEVAGGFRAIWRTFQRSSQAIRVFALALAVGAAFRILAVIIGDIGPGGDGAERLALAISWSQHPYWRGLSGVWPYAHWYFLGSLIRIVGNPVLLAKGINLACGVGALVAIRRAARPAFGELAATVASLLLAIFWTHIWLTSAYWVELPFVLFVLLAVSFAMQTLKTLDRRNALAAGTFLMLALLLRHEGIILAALFLAWAAIKIRRFRVVAYMLAFPALLLAWYFIEPVLHGHSYFEYANFVRQAKAGENLVQGFTLKDCLIQWVLMPAGVPSLLVVIPGFYALWKHRRTAVTELFAWMFASQVLFYFAMTLMYGWRPQLRYIMLYFFNLLPYAAVGWLDLIGKLKIRFACALPVLLLLTIGMQSIAWWVGRNNRREFGWLPVEIRTSSQKALDQWFEGLSKQATRPLSVLAVLPGPVDDPWSLSHSVIAGYPGNDLVQTRNLYMPEVSGALAGQLPDYTYQANLILIYRHSVFYKTVIEALQSHGRRFSVKDINPDIALLAVDPGES